MGELVHPPPPIIASDMQAYTVTEFAHVVNGRMPVLVKQIAVACRKNLAAYPAGKVDLYLLKKPVHHFFIIHTKFGVFDHINVSGYSICNHKGFIWHHKNNKYSRQTRRHRVLFGDLITAACISREDTPSMPG